MSQYAQIPSHMVEAMRRELRNLRLLEAKRKLQDCIADINYLILATPGGLRRNEITDANIHLMGAQAVLDTLNSEAL